MSGWQKSINAELGGSGKGRLAFPRLVQYTVRMNSWTGIFQELLNGVLEQSTLFYSDRLVSAAVFGSVGRRTMRTDSDIDLLLVVDPLPRGRLRRVEEFETVESKLEPLFERARALGVQTRLSPVFKTPAEVRFGSPLLLDMVEDARILYDKDGFLARELSRLRERLAQLGARRIWKGNAWYWDLKPDYKPGEEFQI